jgi:hypothetical protein
MVSHETRTSEDLSKAAANQSFGKDCVSFFPPSFKFVQRKLTIDQPNDIYKRGPNTVTNEAMAMQSAVLERKPLQILSVQRLCSHCEEEEKMRSGKN